MINLKKRLHEFKLSIGSWLTLADPCVAEIMANAGFDWLTVDMEHSAISLESCQQLLQIIGLAGVVPLVRVGENNHTIIKRVMDAGAYGVIVPMVNTRDDVLKALDALKYPPQGKRGVGLGRAQGYGLEFQRYKNWVNKESILIVQIEHISGVENLEEILGVKEIDGLFVGPYDLSASLGKPGEFSHPKVLAALRRVKEAAGKFKVAPGFHVIQPDARELAKKINAGYKLVGFSLDTLFLGLKIKEELGKIKRR